MAYFFTKVGGKMSYTFDKHRYNFAVWTSARAIQRGLKNATSASISKLFKKSNIIKLIDEKYIKNANDFDTLQSEICKILKNAAKDMDIDLSYGRASKLIAIFIKTYYILPEQGKGNISKFAHPPIDKIVLENLKKFGKIKAVPAWTKLNKNEYTKLIKEIRSNTDLNYFWELEEYWKV